MPALSLSLLGPLTATLNDQPLHNLNAKPVQALLIYLAVEKDRPHRREALFTLLWPGMPEKSARHNLSQTLYVLRQTIPAVPAPGNQDPLPLVLADRQTIQLNPDVSIEVDIHNIDALLASTKVHSHAGLETCSTCIAALEKALSIYQGDFLSDFYLEDSSQFEDWAEAVREAYRRKLVDVLVTLADIAISSGDYERSFTLIEQQLSLDDLDERAHRQKIELLARSGRRVEAMRHYREFERQLEDQLGTLPSEEITALYDKIRSDDLSAVHPKEDTSRQNFTAPRHNLPSQPTPFIGRENELDELDALITDPEIRLLTILGPGGMGKTRLALACAERQRSRCDRSEAPCQDGIFFVDLASLNQPDQIIPAMVEALDIYFDWGTGTGDTYRKQLFDYLADKDLLFILDNFEHLLDGAELLSEILAVAPTTQMIVTSRQRLDLRQEQVFTIPGLQFPVWEPPEETASYTAAQFFIAAARRIRPNFGLDPADRIHLRRICQLVDGMPLALELAAGWVELLPLSKIALEIERSLEFLETDLRDMPDRHRSMRAIFDSTWQQLETAEQQMMQTFSVFRGGFSLDAAQQLAGSLEGSTFFLRQLARLVSKSLLQVGSSQERFKVHELLRQYAQDRLERSGGLIAARTAHSKYYLDLLHGLQGDIKGGRLQKEALDKIEADFSNIRDAWNWAASQGNMGDIEPALEALYWFCHLRSRWVEGLKLYRQAEDHFPTNQSQYSNPTWRKITARRISMDIVVTGWEGGYNKKIQVMERILTEARKEEDLAEIAFALEIRASLWGFKSANRESDILLIYKESQSYYQRVGDTFSEYLLLGNISWIYLENGQPEKRLELSQQQFDYAHIKGDRQMMADAQGVIGFVAERNGDYNQAEEKYQEVIHVFQEFGDHLRSSEYTLRLSELAFLAGEFQHARDLHADGYALMREFNISQSKDMAFGILGMILNVDENYSQAAQRLQEITSVQLVQSRFFRSRGLAYACCGQQEFATALDQLRQAIEAANVYKAPAWQVQCLPAAAMIAADDSKLEQAAELLSLAFHHPAAAPGWLSKFPLVIRLQNRLRSDLPKEIFTAAWEQGQSLDLEDALAAPFSESAGEPKVDLPVNQLYQEDQAKSS